jgi:hypothetical protein
VSSLSAAVGELTRDGDLRLKLLCRRHGLTCPQFRSHHLPIEKAALPHVLVKDVKMRSILMIGGLLVLHKDFFWLLSVAFKAVIRCDPIASHKNHRLVAFLLAYGRIVITDLERSVEESRSLLHLLLLFIANWGSSLVTSSCMLVL